MMKIMVIYQKLKWKLPKIVTYTSILENNYFFHNQFIFYKIFIFLSLNVSTKFKFKVQQKIL